MISNCLAHNYVSVTEKAHNYVSVTEKWYIIKFKITTLSL